MITLAHCCFCMVHLCIQSSGRLCKTWEMNAHMQNCIMHWNSQESFNREHFQVSSVHVDCPFEDFLLLFSGIFSWKDVMLLQMWLWFEVNVFRKWNRSTSKCWERFQRVSCVSWSPHCFYLTFLAETALSAACSECFSVVGKGHRNWAVVVIACS